MINKALYSSARETWETPQEFFDTLDQEFGFTLDPCCLPASAKCEKFFTPEIDGLAQSWTGERVFMNPPYGRGIGPWIEKAAEEARAGALVVGLLPARTDTRWFHNHIAGQAEVRHVKGRLKFGEAINSAPFPSIVVIWRPPWWKRIFIKWWKRIFIKRGKK